MPLLRQVGSSSLSVSRTLKGVVSGQFVFRYNLFEPENDTFLGSPSLPLSGRLTRRSSLFFLFRAGLQAPPVIRSAAISRGHARKKDLPSPDPPSTRIILLFLSSHSFRNHVFPRLSGLRQIQKDGAFPSLLLALPCLGKGGSPRYMDFLFSFRALKKP